MNQITSKVCVVGDFAVGKTSVVERFVNNQFSEKYLTTVGVKIDTKEIDLPGRDVRQKLIIWDVAGTDRFADTEFAYLRGASGYIFVADGTRPQTLATVLDIRGRIEQKYGSKVAVLLINKHDLSGQWEVSAERFEALATEFDAAYLTSARTGAEVEAALTRLAELIVDQEIAASQ